MAPATSGGGVPKSPEEQAGVDLPLGSEVSVANNEVAEERPHREQPHQKDKVAPVIRIRRQMQRERKELLAELRPYAPSDRPGTSAQSNPDSPQCTDSVQAAEPMVLLEDLPDAPVLGRQRATTESIMAKVPRAHTGLVRKEVWRQKFDFLYKQVADEMREEKENQSRSSIANTEAGHGKSNMAASGAPHTSSRSRFPSGADLVDITSSSHVSSRPSSACYSKATSVHTSTCQGVHSTAHSTVGVHSTAHSTATSARPRSGSIGVGPRGGAAHAGNRSSRSRTSSSEKTPTSSGGGQDFDGEFIAADDSNLMQAAYPPPSSAVRGGWCRAAKPRWSQQSRRFASRGARGLCGSDSRKNLCVSEQLPRLLSGSASLPLLVAERRARELCGIRDEYYDGDEQIMNEDILHCTNPELFPLRPSHGKPFPLRRLVSYNGHVDGVRDEHW